MGAFHSAAGRTGEHLPLDPRPDVGARVSRSLTNGAAFAPLSKAGLINDQSALVVTSISSPNESLRALARGAQHTGTHFLVIGDIDTPDKFVLDGCDFYDLARQRDSGFRYAELCPIRSYSRKNIGYLLAMHAGAQLIVETDDDNIPQTGFWKDRHRNISGARLKNAGWVNIYSYFSDVTIWPRGLPLDAVRRPIPTYDSLPTEEADCPIQQSLADGNPDVDAVYRLVLPLPQTFRADRRVILSPGSWCPFNSQNTTWFPEAFPLMYLPAYCSFRMTDIWRSFVAQRIAWENGWSISFHEPTVWQDRNEHNIMRDFRDEVPGYIHNRAICESLDRLPLQPGVEHLGANLSLCYAELVTKGWVGEKELELVEAWEADFAAL